MPLQDIIKKLKVSHPDLYPIWYIEDKGAYLFNMLKRGVPKEEAMCNFYAVDAKTGEIVGPVPVLSIYGDPELASKLEKPHMCSSEERHSIRHASPDRPGDFLMHYGIQGMKWGVRRFQNIDGTLTSEGKERYLSKEGEKKDKADSEKVGFFEKQRIKQADRGEQWFKDMEKTLPKEINREETKKDQVDKTRLAVDVAFTIINPLNAINLAADGLGAGIANSKLKSYFKNREEKSTLDPKTGLYLKKDGEYTDKQDLACVNPGVMNMNTNTKSNCMLCTTTYEMRKRGYDVTAQLDSVGYSFADLKRWFPKAKIEKNSRFDENGKTINSKQYVERTLSNLVKQGDGARGNMMVLFNTGGAHSIFYEVQNGKVIFKDGQINSVMDGKMSFSSANKSPQVFLMGTLVNSYARLDNVPANIKAIKEECVR